MNGVGILVWAYIGWVVVGRCGNIIVVWVDRTVAGPQLILYLFRSNNSNALEVKPFVNVTTIAPGFRPMMVS